MPGARWWVVFMALAGPAAPTAAQEEPELVLRYEYQGRFAYGRLEDGVVLELPGTDLFTAAVSTPTGRRYPLENVRPLAPLEPELVEKVVGVARNVRGPDGENPAPNARWYALFPSTLNDPEGDVAVPAGSRSFGYAGGLVVIIGREGRNIPEADAAGYVWGVTVGNHFSDVAWYAERAGVSEPGRVPAAAGDGWLPVGPWVALGLPYDDLRVETRLNGEVVQSGRTSGLLNGIPSLIADLSRYVTLRPGDVIFAGTVPYRAGVRRALQPGDVVETEIQGIGTLRNRIVPMTPPPGGRP